jgi:ubiquitin carboxyl-terminal hydrolase 47
VIDKLYAGRMLDYLRCLDVPYETEREDKFQDLSVAIIPFGGTVACRNLMECIEVCKHVCL